MISMKYLIQSWILWRSSKPDYGRVLELAYSLSSNLSVIVSSNLTSATYGV